MTYKTALSAVVVLAALATTAPVFSQGTPAWNGDINVLVAGKRLDKSDWQPTERQGELGLQTNFQPGSWPIALAADLLIAGRDEPVSRGPFTEQRGRTSELDLGVRKVFRPGPSARPYIGGGLAFASGEIELSGPSRTVSDSDSGVGLWLGGGIFWTLGSSFNLGLDAKVSSAEVNIFGADKNAGGFHLGLLLGYHWGA